MTPRKKVLFVITKSYWGGAQRYVYDLATSLPEDEFEPVVLFGGTGAPDAPAGMLAAKLAEKGIRSVFVGEFARDISFLREWKVLARLVTIFRAEQPAVVHLNSSKAAGIGAVAARLARVPRIIVTAHGWPFLENRSAVKRSLIWLASWITALLCHQVICVSENDARLAKRMPGIARKTVTIHNGIGPMRFGPGDVIRSAFPPGVSITGTIGELTRNKNQIALIEEARKDPSLHVAIVGGDGDARALIEAAIAHYGLRDRVKLFGFMPAEDVLKGFDAFALPSLKEGLPYVLLEAKAAGLPITANRVGGVGEILDAQDMQEFSLERMVRKTVALYR